jgi:pyridoxine 5-phosphate synthase
MQTRAGFSSRRYYALTLLQDGMVKNQAYLTEMIQEFQRNGIRTSIFVDPSRYDRRAKQTGKKTIELYTEAFAHEYGLGNKSGLIHVKAAIFANELGLGIKDTI